MNEIANAKALVLGYFDEFENAGADGIERAIVRHAAEDLRFRGVHPFNEIKGAGGIAEKVWRPLREAFPRMQRRQEIFMAAPNWIDGTLWVSSMGKFFGLFDNDWLGIPSTGKIAMLPYCEFFRIEDGRIAETALFCDIVSVMQQAGLNPLPIQTGSGILHPPPRTQDGLLFEPQDEAESEKTLELILRMCDDLVVKDGWQSPNSSLANTWHDDMVWFGPAGIGSTYTIERYQVQHQGPFRAGLDDIVFNGHVLEHAEGCYGGWFGWANLSMKQGEGFMGLPASERPTEMRVVDMYRREGDKLAENWVFIDMLHYLLPLGVDLLERCRSIART
ncbi:MAG: ester cyclase [Gammaproteobacteria bacterium]|nr:ester cyclase [Chromatiales bacterium]MYE48142.1 ester cyclase [Gammaproteobacteria bacterium]